jgi:hypothetical protein
MSVSLDYVNALLEPKQPKQPLVVRAGDLERLGKEFFPHLIAKHARDLVETLFGLRGYVLVIKP